jgi:hypothetical protein
MNRVACRTGQNKIIVASNAREAFEKVSKEIREAAEVKPGALAGGNSDDGSESSGLEDSDKALDEDIPRLVSKLFSGDMSTEDEEALKRSLARIEERTAVPAGPRSAVGTSYEVPLPTAKPKPPLLLSAGFRRKMRLVEEMFGGASGAALQTYWLTLVRGGHFEVCVSPSSTEQNYPDTQTALRYMPQCAHTASLLHR